MNKYNITKNKFCGIMRQMFYVHQNDIKIQEFIGFNNKISDTLDDMFDIIMRLLRCISGDDGKTLNGYVYWWMLENDYGRNNKLLFDKNGNKFFIKNEEELWDIIQKDIKDDCL